MVSPLDRKLLRELLRMKGQAFAILLLVACGVATPETLHEHVQIVVAQSGDYLDGEVEVDRNFRVGGLVVDGSIRRESDGSVAFRLTDTANEIEVHYQGILPDLFREGQGIVAQGTLVSTGANPVLSASEILAKHDENYMPREVTDALKEAGYWQHNEAPGGEATGEGLSQ